MITPNREFIVQISGGIFLLLSTAVFTGQVWSLTWNPFLPAPDHWPCSSEPPSSDYPGIHLSS